MRFAAIIKSVKTILVYKILALIHLNRKKGFGVREGVRYHPVGHDESSSLDCFFCDVFSRGYMLNTVV